MERTLRHGWRSGCTILLSTLGWLALVPIPAPGVEKERRPAAPATAQPAVKLPPWEAVQHTTESCFVHQGSSNQGTFNPGSSHQQQDLISRGEAEQVFGKLKQAGWDVAERQEILEKMLPDSHVLVKTFRSPAGKTFMRKVGSRSLIYDRLDRVSQVAGGPRLIQDLVKLPDGERYAKPHSGGGVPDLLDLLPKGASGKTRQIPDYHKPTGKIYTVPDLLKHLGESYRKATDPALAAPGSGVASGKGAGARSSTGIPPGKTPATRTP